MNSGHKPSIATSSQTEYLTLPGGSSDCRTRINDYRLALRKQSSSHRGTTLGKPGVGFEITPASIFEHRRLPLRAAEEGAGHTTDVRYPSSFDEIERWLDGHIQRALVPAAHQGDMASSINVLFIDEKKCSKVFNQDFALNRLLPKFKISGWCTSHYQTTFCRYPLPLDRDCDDEVLQHTWHWRYSLSHPFDWDLLWAYFPTTRSTVAIVRTWFDGYDTNFTQLENEIKDFEGPTLAHPMLFGLLALQVLTSDAMANVREKGNIIYEAQTLTGFHQYSRLRATDNDGNTISFDLGGVSRKVIGAASHITGWDNATVEMAEFAHFARSENQRYMASGCFSGNGLAPVINRLCVYVDEQAEKLIRDIKGAHHDSRA
jgi:hypothetical protein